MKSIRTFCVSHDSPQLPDAFYDLVIGLGDYVPKRGTRVVSIDPYWAAQRPLAYGAAGGYVIPKLLARADSTTDLTGIASHRKVVLRRQIGRESTTYPGMREATAVELAALGREELGPAEGSEFLISTPLNFPQGLVRQYADSHHVIDLFDYLSIAAKMGILTATDVSDFVKTSLLFPGGCELGVYPTAWLSESLAKLEAIGREFLTRHGDRVRQYDGYQIRAVGFLSERLGSFLLLKEFMRRFPAGIPRELIGHMACVVSSGQSYQRCDVSDSLRR